MELQEKQQELEKRRKHLLKIKLIFYTVATAGVLLYLWSPVVGITIAAAGMLGVFLVANPSLKEFRLTVKQQVMESNYAPFLTNFNYKFKEGVSLSAIVDSGLLWLKNNGKGYIGREHVTGSYKGHAFEQSDISVLRRQFADELAEKGKVEYVIGCIAIQDCGAPFGASVELIHKNFLNPGEAERFFAQKPGFAPVEVSDEELKKDFDIVSDNPEIAAQILAPHVTKRIRKLQERSGAPVLVGFVGSKLFVILKSRFMNDEYNPKRPLPENMFTTKQLPEMSEFFELADVLLPNT